MAVIDTITRIRERYNEAILDATEFADCHTLHIRGENNLDILTTLKDDEEFNFLAGITAVDNLHLGGFERFAIVYHLLSHKKKERLTVKAYVSGEKPKLSSVESLWKTADWQEREVYDLFGIEFENHPNLIRIMNPEDYTGHSLRKDYPRQGRGERKDFLVVERGIGSKFSRK